MRLRINSMSAFSAIYFSTYSMVKTLNNMAVIGTRVACYCPLTLPESRWSVTEYTMTCHRKEFQLFEFHGSFKEKETVYCYECVGQTFSQMRQHRRFKTKDFIEIP